MTRDEPCSIDAADVCEFLERQRSPKRAEFVRHLDQLARDADRREALLRADIAHLAARLHRYEPPPQRQPDVVWTGD